MLPLEKTENNLNKLIKEYNFDSYEDYLGVMAYIPYKLYEDKVYLLDVKQLMIILVEELKIINYIEYRNSDLEDIDLLDIGILLRYKDKKDKNLIQLKYEVDALAVNHGFSGTKPVKLFEENNQAVKYDNEVAKHIGDFLGSLVFEEDKKEPKPKKVENDKLVDDFMSMFVPDEITDDDIDKNIKNIKL